MFLLFLNRVHAKNAQIQNRLLQIGLKKDKRVCFSVIIIKKTGLATMHLINSRGSVTGLFKECLEKFVPQPIPLFATKLHKLSCKVDQ